MRAQGTDGATATGLRAATIELRDALTETVLPLPLPGTSALDDARTRLLDQLEDHVLPRLADPGRPVLVVVGGSTGVGKSTLVNTLVGTPVTQSGLARPTTRSPVLVHHPVDTARFGSDEILPTFTRTDRATNDPGQIQLVPAASLPQGVALLDAPDFDSVDDENRVLATRLLAAADVWLFVTSAARYADELPWRHLEVARQRRTPLLIVMNRIQPDDLETVSTDYARQLRARGIGDREVVFVQHHAVVDQMLPADRVVPIRNALELLAGSRGTDATPVAHGVTGTLMEAAALARAVADAAHHQAAAGSELAGIVNRTYAASAAGLAAAATNGSLLRGELLAAWRNFIGTDEPLPMADMMRLARERLIGSGARPGGPDGGVGRLELAIDLALETLVLDHAEQATLLTGHELRTTAHGGALLDRGAEDLSRPDRRLDTHARTAIAEWRRELTAAVFDLNADGDAASTRGLVTGLAVCALGTKGADPGARSTPGMVATARAGLSRALIAVLGRERDRFLRPVTGSNLGAPERLRAAADRVHLLAERSGRHA